MLLDSIRNDKPVFRVIGRNFDSVTEALNSKRSYAFERSGVVRDSDLLAEDLGIKSPWKVEEDK